MEKDQSEVDPQGDIIQEATPRFLDLKRSSCSSRTGNRDPDSSSENPTIDFEPDFVGDEATPQPQEGTEY